MILATETCEEYLPRYRTHYFGVNSEKALHLFGQNQIKFNQSIGFIKPRSVES